MTASTGLHSLALALTALGCASSLALPSAPQRGLERAGHRTAAHLRLGGVI